MIKQIKPIYSEVKTSLKGNEYLVVVAVFTGEELSPLQEQSRISFNLPLTEKNVEAIKNFELLDFNEDDVRNAGWNKAHSLYYITPEVLVSDKYDLFK